MKTRSTNVRGTNGSAKTPVSRTHNDEDQDPMTDDEFEAWVEQDTLDGLKALNQAALEDPAPQPLTRPSVPPRHTY
ncbi:MAG TPA: hypothetical protein PLV87_02685 [Opitutaceae bacterium]|nr:hypothetical protein [Opitutaceae bacterium]